MSRPIAAVKEVFDGYQKPVRARLLEIRELIFQVAAKTEGVGPLEETLKWNEPAYLTSQSGSGSTMRLGPVKTNARKAAIFFNCRTTLIDDFKQLYPRLFQYQGNRAIILNVDKELPTEALQHCLALAMTYHLNKKKK